MAAPLCEPAARCRSRVSKTVVILESAPLTLRLYSRERRRSCSYDVTSMLRKTPRQFDLAGVLILLVGVAIPLSLAYLATRPAAPPSAATSIAPPVPTLQLISATRELKLITMTIDSRVH